MSKNDIATLMNGIITDPTYTKIFNKPIPQLNKTASVKKETKTSMSQYEVLVRGLSKLSEMLDDVGLEKAATYTLLSLEDVVANSSKIAKAESCSDCVLCDEEPLRVLVVNDKEDEKDESDAADLPERWETIEDLPKDEPEVELLTERWEDIEDKPELLELRKRMTHPEIQDEEFSHPEIQDEEAYQEIQDKPELLKLREMLEHPEIQDEVEEVSTEDPELEQILKDIESGKIESGELEQMEASKAAKSQSSLQKLAKELKKSLTKKDNKKEWNFNKLDPKAKTRNKSEAVFDDKHPKVTDKKDHFPIDTIGRARNALARANQFDKAPEWWSGSLKELKNTVVRAVHAKYPSIEITKKAKD